MKAETKTNNRLWQARRRAGLEQKQVARLLGHRNCDQISRYERGVRVPGLRIALKLEIIYRTSVGALFPDHYEAYRREIAGNVVQTGNPLFETVDEVEQLPDAHVCTYGNSLLQKKPTTAAIDDARRHTIKLVRRVGDACRERRQREN